MFANRALPWHPRGRQASCCESGALTAALALAAAAGEADGGFPVRDGGPAAAIHGGRGAAAAREQHRVLARPFQLLPARDRLLRAGAAAPGLLARYWEQPPVWCRRLDGDVQAAIWSLNCYLHGVKFNTGHVQECCVCAMPAARCFVDTLTES